MVLFFSKAEALGNFCSFFEINFLTFASWYWGLDFSMIGTSVMKELVIKHIEVNYGYHDYFQPQLLGTFSKHDGVLLRWLVLREVLQYAVSI